MCPRTIDDIILETNWYEITVKDFCKQYGVSESSVHKKRRLLNCDFIMRAKAVRNRNSKGKFIPKYFDESGSLISSSSDSDPDNEEIVIKNNQDLSIPSITPKFNNMTPNTEFLSVEECKQAVKDMKKNMFKNKKLIN